MRDAQPLSGLMRSSSIPATNSPTAEHGPPGGLPADAAGGNRTPQIAFLTPFGDPASTVHRLFKDLYSTGEYQDSWFRWEGKPIILAHRAKVSGPERDFFTFRKPQPDYFRPRSRTCGVGSKYIRSMFFRMRVGRRKRCRSAWRNDVGNRLGSMSEPETARPLVS